MVPRFHDDELADGPHRNSRAAPDAPPEPAPPPPPAPAMVFVNPHRRERVVPLAFPFLWEGRVLNEVTVRRVTAGEYGDWADRTTAGEADSADLYAIMTGLPASVFRGLDAEDGLTVAEAAFDFLPRELREGIASPGSREDGATTSET